MTEELTREIILNPKNFINEIVKNHGVDSMQYVMAVNVVREAQFKLSQLQERVA